MIIAQRRLVARGNRRGRPELGVSYRPKPRSRTVWHVMGAVTGVEFLFRKTWFRYYARSGPVERLWSILFPAERTERGRRSMEYIRRMRGEQRKAAEAAGRAS